MRYQGVIGSMMPRLSVKLHSARLNQSQPNHVSLIFARVKQLWESSRDVDVSLAPFFLNKYRKIPIISLGAYIFQRPFLRSLFFEGLIYGGKFAFQNR